MHEKAANKAANKARAKQRKLEVDEEEEHEWQATAACVEEARQEQARQDTTGAQEVERQAAEAKESGRRPKKTYNESEKKNESAVRARAALKVCARLFASAWDRRYVRSFRPVRRSV